MFFEGWSWFKLNDVRLSLGMTSKFGTSVLPGLKLNVRKCWVLIPIIVEVTGETGRGAFPLILSRVKAYSCILRHSALYSAQYSALSVTLAYLIPRHI